MDDSDGERPYRVGYGKPPIEHQFKKGQSGYKGKRPTAKTPKVLNGSQVLDKVLQTEVTIQLEGKSKRVSLLEALLYREANRALNGDQRSIKLLFDLSNRTMRDQKRQVDEVRAALAQVLSDDELFDEATKTGLIRAAQATGDTRLIIDVEAAFAARGNAHEGSLEKLIDAIRQVARAQEFQKSFEPKSHHHDDRQESPGSP